MKNINMFKIAAMVSLLLLCVPTDSIWAQRVRTRNTRNGNEELAKEIVGSFFNRRKNRDKKEDEAVKERRTAAKETTRSRREATQETKNAEEKGMNSNAISETSHKADEVELVVSADGTSKESAIFSALRSAIEQTFGAFVSSNTSFVNDELVKDEIVSVSSGNVKEYKVLYEKEENGKYYITLNAVISINKLVSFAQSKGAETELAGATFGMNLKMMNLNRQNEEVAISNLQSQISEMCKTVSLFDYSIEVMEPKINNYGKVECEAIIKIIPNQNGKAIEQLIANTYSSLSLSVEEREKMKAMGMQIYVVPVDFYKGGGYGGNEHVQRNLNKEHYYMRTNAGRQLGESMAAIVPKYDFVLIDNLGTYIATKSIVDQDKEILLLGKRGDAKSKYKLKDDGTRGGNVDLGGLSHYKDYGHWRVGNTLGIEYIKATLYYTQNEINQISNLRIEPLVSSSLDIDVDFRVYHLGEWEEANKVIHRLKRDSITINGERMKKEEAVKMMEERYYGNR